MNVRGLSGYTTSWVQRRAEVTPLKDSFSQNTGRKAPTEVQSGERDKLHEFTKDELKRLREFMATVGEPLESMDDIIRNFERIDTKRKGAITAEQVKAFESSSAETVAPAQPLRVDQNDAPTPMAKAPMENYLDKYKTKIKENTSTFERSE